MHELTTSIPDAQVLLTLEPEELAGKILFVLCKRTENSRQQEQYFILSNLLSDLWPVNYLPGYQHPYLSDSSVDWAQQLPHVKQWVDAHPGEECWFAYSAYPILRPQAYGIPCHPLPTAHTGDEILPVDVPETIHGNILLSADDLEACDWPSDQLNVFERFRWMPMAEQIDHSVFVYHGVFHVREAAALGSVQKSTILLRENRPAEALVAAKKAVALQPGNLLAQMALGDTQTASGDKDSARAAYELALAAAHRLEADAQPLFVPDLEQKLHQ